MQPFIVCGQLANSSVIPKRLAPVVEAGIMPAKLVPDWENPARGLYFEHPQRQRDEAVRTGAIGATAMIYAARALGLGSTPMIGFDAEAVAREFALAEDELVVRVRPSPIARSIMPNVSALDKVAWTVRSAIPAPVAKVLTEGSLRPVLIVLTKGA